MYNRDSISLTLEQINYIRFKRTSNYDFWRDKEYDTYFILLSYTNDNISKEDLDNALLYDGVNLDLFYYTLETL